ncbi:MAG: adenylate/guanylate cyclase domain-containing protein [Deltaproteobacteria bacterium]|nr:adenylate/guanylate cyclase domain-containing protein [Deltaproteobacteria bacterium]
MNVLLSKVRPFHIALLVGVLTAALTFLIHENSHRWRTSLLEMAEYKVLDAKFLFRGRVDVEPGVVIAAGDEKAIAQFGVWGSWDREIFARIVKNLKDAGSDVIAFDMVFADPASIGAQKAKKIDVVREEVALAGQAFRMTAMLQEGAPDEDIRVAAKILAEGSVRIEALLDESRSGTSQLAASFEENSSNVVQGFIANPSAQDDTLIKNAPADMESLETFTLEEYGFGWLESKSDDAKSAGAEGEVATLNAHEGGKATDLRHVPEVKGGFVVPLPSFADAAENAGFFNADPDPDGVMRRLPLVFRFGDVLIPSLALSAAALHFGSTPALLADPANKQGLAAVGFAAESGNTIEVPVDHSGALLISYLGKSIAYNERDALEDRGVFRRVSLADIYSNTFDKSLVKGRVTIVAVTAIGTYDQRVTPFSPIVPGVEVHAAAVQSMITGAAISRRGRQVQLEMLLAIFIALVLGVALKRLPIWSGTVFVVILSIVWVFIDAKILFANNIWAHQMPIQLQLLISWGGITLHGYLTEGREKAQLKKEFSTVLSPTVVDQLLNNPELAGLGGDERVMTVMFSDIRGFTTMSEMMSPEELTAFLNEYLTPMTDILIEHNGTLDKYMGDAIMAFWGAPIQQEDHALRSCLTALEMMDKLYEMQVKWRAEGKPIIDIGIGMNSGMMRVGFMGSERMRNYTLLGDNVNLGARLEGINKQYATNIIISEVTLEMCKGGVYARRLDAVKVKGKQEPVTIYELRGAGAPSEEEKQFINSFEEAFHNYQEQRFEEALSVFRQLADKGDKTSKIYVDRCLHFQEEPPHKDWDGVFEMTTK